MATRPAVANVIKHQLMWYWRAQWCVTTIRTLHDGAPTQARVDADRDVIAYWAAGSWAPRAGTDCELRQLKAWSLATVPPTPFAPRDLYPLSTVVGTEIDCNVTPQALGLAISLRTGDVGEVPKPPHGRIYHVGGHPYTDLTLASDISNSEKTQVLTAYEALRAALDGGDPVGLMCIVSYWLGGTREVPVLRGTPLALPVTHVQCTRQLGLQRRRMPRRQSYVVN